MFRINRPILRVGTVVLCALLVCIALLGIAGRSQARQASGLSLDLYPQNQEIPFACLGKPLRGWFIVNAVTQEPVLSDPLKPTQIQVTASPPLAGTLSSSSWTIQGSMGSKGFTYTPAKTGSEHLQFTAAVLNAASAPLVKSIDFKVVNCRYQITITGEIQNLQGGITSNIFYNGEGTLSLTQNGGSGWSIMGRGTTTLEEYVDGTEGDVTCVTTSPGTGTGSFWIEGEADPAAKLKPVFHFTDIRTGVGQSCKDSGNGKTQSGAIPSTGWLPNSGSGGVVKGLEFLAQGEQKSLDVSQVNDARWVEGSSTGTMQISIEPEANK